MAATIAGLMNMVKNLEHSEKLALNRILCEMIRSENKLKQASVGFSFKFGQLVSFDAKSKGIKHMKIEGFNRARTAVKGMECDKDGNFTTGVRWTVANTLIRA